MKSKKVEISKINIRIGDKEIPLTLEEAQELRQILDETFGQKTVFYPSTPIYIERPYVRPWQWWEAPIVTCGNTLTYTLRSDGASSTFSSSDALLTPVVN